MLVVIQGHSVYSNKGLGQVVGTRINFTDGSWCDVATGQIINKGPGYITIGSPPEEGERKVTGHGVYAARNLKVNSIVADLYVQVHQNNKGDEGIEVDIVGPAHEASKIRVNRHGDTVIIEGDEVAVESRCSIVIGRGNNIIQQSIGGVFIITTGYSKNQTKITVRVPKGASVSLSGIAGNSTIGDTHGDLLVGGINGDINAGCVANTTLSVMGGSEINVLEVNGSLNMSIMGSGDIKVRRGKVSALAISVIGSGDATFDGHADNATFTVMGSGDIRVEGVKNRPSKNIMGSGDIHIGNW